MPSTRRAFSRSTFLSVVLFTACFDPESPMVTIGGTETESTGATTCSPGEEQACTCTDGDTGTRTCTDDGTTFGMCSCTPSSTSTTDPTAGPASDPSLDDSSSAAPPECEADADCRSMAEGDCETAVCSDGACVVEPVPEGEPCGRGADDECSAPDTCDGDGSCIDNHRPDGTDCNVCDFGACSCTAGTCDDCNDFAPINHFVTARSIFGWELTGGWGLYRAAPQNHSSNEVLFPNQVFGTDGNRVPLYPGAEHEVSTARTRPTVLPATLVFLSWHVDEGAVDIKRIRVSVDGGATFFTLADCSVDASQPFCQPRDSTRAADDWDVVELDVPPELLGQIGIVELSYDTQDACCGDERGWFIDAVNFATECDCNDDVVCETFGGTCGAAACGPTGQCELDAAPLGTMCGDAGAGQCGAADACDGVGYCYDNDLGNGIVDCEDCSAGLGACNACLEGTCADCMQLAVVDDFAVGLPGWSAEDLSGTGADWRIYANAVPVAVDGSGAIAFPSAPVLGVDGNRQATYPGAELEASRITTPPDIVPATLTFSSWHVDEGVDLKSVELTVDGGATWTPLVDCQAGINPQVFCSTRTEPRAGDEWDAIALDTTLFEGQTGQLRFGYNTQDGCCTFERGWYIDDLSFAQYCSDPLFP